MDEIWTFIARDSIDEANRFIDKLGDQLKTQVVPERCPVVPENNLLDNGYRHFLCESTGVVPSLRGNSHPMVK